MINWGLLLLIMLIAATGASMLAKSSGDSIGNAFKSIQQKSLGSGSSENGKQFPMSLEGKKPKVGPLGDGIIGKVANAGNAIINKAPAPIRTALRASSVVLGTSAILTGTVAGTLEAGVVRPTLRQITRPFKFLGKQIYKSPVGQMAIAAGNGIKNTTNAVKKGAKAAGKVALKAADTVLDTNTGLAAGVGIGLIAGAFGMNKIANSTNARHNGKLQVNRATGGGYGVLGAEDGESKRYVDSDDSIKKMLVMLASKMREYNKEMKKTIQDKFNDIQVKLDVNSKEQSELREKMVSDIANKLPKELKVSLGKEDYQKLAREMMKRYEFLLKKNSAENQAKKDANIEDKNRTESILRKSIEGNTAIRENYKTYVATYNLENKEDEEAMYDQIIEAMTEDMDGNEAKAILGKQKEAIKRQVEESKKEFAENREQFIAQRTAEIENPEIGNYLKEHPEVKSMKEAKEAIKAMKDDQAYNEALEYVVSKETNINTSSTRNSNRQRSNVSNDNPIQYNNGANNNDSNAEPITAKNINFESRARKIREKEENRKKFESPGPIDNRNVG